MTKVIIVGEAYNADLQIGGGPIYPPSQPPGIWGPPGPWPTPPIAWPQPPVDPGYGIPVAPPGFWPGTPPPRPHPQPPLGIWGGAPIPWPTPPIYYPPGSPGSPPGYWGGGPHPMPPIYYPGQPPSGGGSPGLPTFPIWGPPGIELPPGSGYPPVAGHPLPQPPTDGAQPVVGWEARTVWIPAGENQGWAVVIVPKEGTEVPTPAA